ncbi:malto-oligosyltrehalose trehalohydrolase [Zavarzinella formosa]|uniref:malto-oligosyltrehalose trehalohydrolase n=1 Tax=Zavarzinella formosa TaxID=360055 RepID=UPI00030856E2|nr:malto-oligosyltrehalose trehalohydrolase [Zavarzinella formosa]
MAEDSPVPRRYPIGAEVIPDRGVHLRVWAPARSTVEAVFEGGTTIPLNPEAGGYYSGWCEGVTADSLYRFRLDGGPILFPDPASRCQPDGPHGPSQVVGPSSFRWDDSDWTGLTETGQVLYELHLGTFTPGGTWKSAAERLPELADLGITAVEVMPVADFPGAFGWGYDGVSLFAPAHQYGPPDDMRMFINTAHKLGLGVILDVVYNHFGPDGNYIREFAPAFLSDRHMTEWGDPFNFDGPQSGPVREFFIANAAYWIREFHLDGLRLDATQAIIDDSPVHILTEIGRAVREAAGTRSVFIMAENEPQEADLVRPIEKGGSGLDALWNDDLHHAIRVALTGKNEGYYTDYLGTPQELISATKWGFLYQGQQFSYSRQRRGRPAFDIPRHKFVTFIENHDQVSNSGRGLRVHQLTSPSRYRAMTAFFLLGPGTPMLFQGQEYGSTKPFLYFADHHPDLAALVMRGRRESMRRFRSQATPDGQRLFSDPAAPETFNVCKLDPAERANRGEWIALHKDLLTLRKNDPAFRTPTLDGAVLGMSAFVIRYFVPEGEDRLLVVNLGRDLHLEPAPEPLLAPPVQGTHWHPIWSSEEARYGGHGTAPLDTEESWRIPGEAAVLLGAK